MAVLIDLSPELEAEFAEEAHRRGLPLEQFLRDHLAHHSPKNERERDARELEHALDEVAATVPPGTPPIPAEALRRESLLDRSLKREDIEAAKRLMRAFDEIAALVPTDRQPIPMEALRRENLYGDDER